MDNDTRRKKQQELMTELIERKIRLHAQHLYDQRGQEEGLALQDWVEAESRVLENSILAPLYRKSRGENGSWTKNANSEKRSSSADRVVQKRRELVRLWG